MEEMNTDKCQICGEGGGSNNMRLGVCWWCAEVESIIAEGLDMDDRGLNGATEPAKSAMDKVRLLRQKSLLLHRGV